MVEVQRNVIQKMVKKLTKNDEFEWVYWAFTTMKSFIFKRYKLVHFNQSNYVINNTAQRKISDSSKLRWPKSTHLLIHMHNLFSSPSARPSTMSATFS